MKLFIGPQGLWRQVGAFFAGLLLRATPRLSCVLTLMLVALLAVPASAQTVGKMLFLTTTECAGSGTNPATGNPCAGALVANAQTVFATQAAQNNLTFVPHLGLLTTYSSGTPDPADLGITADTRLVVIVTFDGVVSTASMSALSMAMSSNPDLAIVIFSDGCCQVSTNLNKFVAAVNSIKPTSWPAIGTGPSVTGAYTAILNTASLYEVTFTHAGLNQFSAFYYTPITNVLPDYALYRQQGMLTNTVGLFIPQTASSNGLGACVFLTGDASEFDTTKSATIPASQYPHIAQAFIDAALDPNGSCAQPASGAPDLAVEVYGPDHPSVGNSSRMELTITNINEPGITSSTDGQVTVTLGAGLTLDSASLPTGCTANLALTSFTCQLSSLQATLNPGDRVTVDFDIVASAPGLTDVPITAEVSGVTGEINLGNNTNTAYVSTDPSTPDLMVILTGVMSGVTVSTELGLAVDSPSTITATVTNISANSSSDGQIKITLPGDLQLSGSLPAGCGAPTTTVAGTVFVCDLPALDATGGPNDHVAFQFQVISPEPILADAPILAVVSGVTGEVNLANNEDPLYVYTTGSPYLEVELGGPGTIPVNTASTMTVTVSNGHEPGTIASPGVLTVTLPPELTLVSPPAGCTDNATTPPSFTCLVPTLQPGENTGPLQFQVSTSTPITKVEIHAEVTWAFTRSGQTASNQAMMNVSSALLQTPIPALANLTLALLALTLAASAAAGLRRKG